MKIGIEKSLSNVKNHLEQNNNQVVVMNNEKNDSTKALKKYDAIVSSGMDSNFLGMHDTSTKTPIINAAGKTPEEVQEEIQNRLE